MSLSVAKDNLGIKKVEASSKIPRNGPLCVLSKTKNSVIYVLFIRDTLVLFLCPNTVHIIFILYILYF
jgi:hypothetical protein